MSEEIHLGTRASRVPILYGIVVRTGGEHSFDQTVNYTAVSAKLERDDDLGQSVLVHVFDREEVPFLPVEEEDDDVYEAILMFWAAPERFFDMGKAQLLLSVTDEEGSVHETCIALTMTGTDPVISVAESDGQEKEGKLESDGKETLITFVKDGEDDDQVVEKILTVSNNTPEFAPVLVNAVVTDDAAGAFHLFGDDGEDPQQTEEQQYLPMYIPAGEARSFRLVFKLPPGITVRKNYYGSALVKLATALPSKDMYPGQDIDLDQYYDHVLNLEAICPRNVDPFELPYIEEHTAQTMDSIQETNNVPTPAKQPRSRPSVKAAIDTKEDSVDLDNVSEKTRAWLDGMDPDYRNQLLQVVHDEEAPKSDIENIFTHTQNTAEESNQEGDSEVIAMERYSLVVDQNVMDPLPSNLEGKPRMVCCFSLEEPVEWLPEEGRREDASEDFRHEGREEEDIQVPLPLHDEQSPNEMRDTAPDWDVEETSDRYEGYEQENSQKPTPIDDDEHVDELRNENMPPPQALNQTKMLAGMKSNDSAGSGMSKTLMSSGVLAAPSSANHDEEASPYDVVPQKEPQHDSASQDADVARLKEECHPVPNKSNSPAPSFEAGGVRISDINRRIERLKEATNGLETQNIARTRSETILGRTGRSEHISRNSDQATVADSVPSPLVERKRPSLTGSGKPPLPPGKSRRNSNHTWHSNDTRVQGSPTPGLSSSPKAGSPRHHQYENANRTWHSSNDLSSSPNHNLPSSSTTSKAQSHATSGFHTESLDERPPVRGWSSSFGGSSLNCAGSSSRADTFFKSTSGSSDAPTFSVGTFFKSTCGHNISDAPTSSVGTFTSAGPVKGGFRQMAKALLKKTPAVQPKLKMPRKVLQRGLRIKPKSGSTLLPIYNDTSSSLNVHVSVKKSLLSKPAVTLETTFVAIRSGQSLDLKINRAKAEKGEAVVVLECVTTGETKSASTIYNVPLKVEAAERRVPTVQGFAVDRPTLTFHNPKGSARICQVRILNGTQTAAKFKVWIGDDENQQSHMVNGESIFTILSDSKGVIQPGKHISVLVSFDCEAGNSCYRQDLNVSVAGRVDNIPMFGYSGASDLKLSLTKGGLVRVRNVGNRSGFVVLTGPEIESESNEVERVIVQPGTAREFQLPYGTGTTIYTGDEIARSRMCRALSLFDPERGGEDEGLFTGKFEGSEDARKREKLNWKKDNRYTLHYAGRLLDSNVVRYELDPVELKIVRFDENQREADVNWQATIDDGYVHIENYDPKRRLKFRAYGAEPAYGTVPPLGDAKLAAFTDVVRVKGRDVERVLALQT